MPYIEPNKLLTPTEKLIKPYECSFIAIEGPNLKGKLTLEGLEIPYDSFYLSQLILNESSKDQPLLYGFLGTNVTFVMIRAKYMPVLPHWQIETEQYIEYYFKDDPSEVRAMGQLMVLSGNSARRVPQIMLNNPSSKYKVQLEVLTANLPQSSLTGSTLQFTDMSSFTGLYYNSIITNQIISGSTELKVLDSDSDPVMIIPFSSIRTILKVNDTTLWIGNDTEEKIQLEFLSSYQTDQANSRINWVLEDSNNRYLTKTNLPVDTEAPTILWNMVLTGSTTGLTSDTTILYLLPSGTTYADTIIRDIIISGATDNRDGLMNKNNVGITITQINDIVPVSGITDVGVYELTFDVKDIANNSAAAIKYLAIYYDNYTTGFWNDSGVWEILQITV